MNDSFTTTTHTSFFGSLKNAIVGTLIGLIMVPASIAGLAWNEYRTIKRTQGIAEGAEIVQTVSDPSSANPSYAGALIHLNGRAETQERLRDDVFGIEVLAIRLMRDVESYQWIENVETVNRDGKQVTTYEYKKDWNEKSLSHAQFKHPEGHENREPTFASSSFVAKNVTLGAYRLDGALKNSIDSFQKMKWSQDLVNALPSDIQANSTTKGKYLYWSDQGAPNVDSPQVGDQRIVFRVVRPTEVSLISAVNEKAINELKPFVTTYGEKLQRLFVGNFTAAEVFQKMQGENETMAWMLRGGGLMFCFIGFTLIMGVLSAMTERIPLVGTMAGGVIGFVSFLLAIMVTSLTIAIAWIAVRPLIAALLIALAIGVAVVVWRTARKRSDGITAAI